LRRNLAWRALGKCVFKQRQLNLTAGVVKVKPEQSCTDTLFEPLHGMYVIEFEWDIQCWLPNLSVVLQLLNCGSYDRIAREIAVVQRQY